jgi:4-hydroxybenzoate polyprenyltransferase
VAEPAVGQVGAKAARLPSPLKLGADVLLSMRPIQWTKSLMVFLPLAFSVNERWQPGEGSLVGELLLRVVAGAAIFCALSGAVYIVNDIFDRRRDAVHPTKQRRPIASGELPVAAARTIALMVAALSLAASFLLDLGFGVVGVAFLALNLGYSSYLKRIIILDVMVVSAGYLLRVLAGALIIDVAASPWLYTTIGLGALFIALGKRYSELAAAGAGAPDQRTVLGEYSHAFLGQLISITGTATLVAYALYTFTARNVPQDHSMMLTIPFVVFGLFRYLYLVNRTYDAESPERVILRDRPLLIDIAMWGASAVIILAVSR